MSLVLCALVACGGNTRAPVEDRSTQPQYPAYSVKRGDTLYSIAFRYGLDFRKVAAANKIMPPYTIYPGQRIYLNEAGLPGIAVAKTPATAPTRAPPKVGVAPPVRAPSPVYTPAPGSGSSGAVAPLMVPRSIPTTPGPVTAPVPSPSIAATKPETGTGNYVGAKVGSWLWPTSGPVTRDFSESVHKGIDIGGARGDPIVAVAAGKVVYAGTGIVGFGELLIIKHNEIYLSAYGHNERLLVAEGQAVVAGQTIAEKGSSGTDMVKLHFEIRKEGKPIDPLRVLPRR